MIKNFNLFESADSQYEILATNTSKFSWEYDNIEVIANILLDKSDMKTLYLEVKNVHVKSGLGSGTFKKNLEFLNVGTLQKPNLLTIRTILKKHNLSQVKFSRFWEDDEGNKISLGDLLKSKSKESKELKHIKSIENFDENDQDIEIVQYSEKSFAIFGKGTKNIKEELKSIGCKFNPFLVNPNTNKKTPGWIFPLNKLDKVRMIINK